MKDMRIKVVYVSRFWSTPLLLGTHIS